MNREPRFPGSYLGMRILSHTFLLIPKAAMVSAVIFGGRQEDGAPILIKIVVNSFGEGEDSALRDETVFNAETPA